jgi:lysophospholipase L1-like esterase
VILAYGTNDILIAEAEPIEVADAYTRLQRRARGGGVDVFVALTPPVQPANGEINGKIVELNELLAERFRSSRLIDFWSGMQPADYLDNVHLGASGHAKRATAAVNALAAAAGSAEAP